MFGTWVEIRAEIVQNSVVMKTVGKPVMKIFIGVAIALTLACCSLFFTSNAYAQAARGFPDARMQDFERQRACEKNLPTCLPQIRRQMEQREVAQRWQSAMIVGVLVLIGLLVVRANNKKKLEDQQMVARSRQAARKRKEKSAAEEDDDDMTGGLPRRSTIERPPGFGRR